mgnify:CR=1 FL=1
MKNGFIFNKQLLLFNDNESKKNNIIGYRRGVNSVKYINRKTANDIIKQNHYSGTYVNNSIDHFGYFIGDKLLGVLQFGHMLNPAAYNTYIPSTSGISEYRELNRMFLFDEAPRNSESQAISFCIKVLKQKYRIKWVQSFADERCGKLGIVYQAANFHFFGSHINEFYVYQNRAYHKIMYTSKKHIKHVESRHGESIEIIKSKSVKHALRQFRYIYFIDKRLINDCILTAKPYPKHYNEDQNPRALHSST